MWPKVNWVAHLQWESWYSSNIFGNEDVTISAYLPRSLVTFCHGNLQIFSSSLPPPSQRAWHFECRKRNPRDSQDSCGLAGDFLRFLRNPMDSWGFLGIPGDSRWFLRILEISAVIPGNSQRFSGFLRVLYEFSRVSNPSPLPMTSFWMCQFLEISDEFLKNSKCHFDFHP